jgi:DNA-binding response OmpR family regulator
VTTIHIATATPEMAQSLIQALKPLWPEAIWVMDVTDDVVLRLAIGSQTHSDAVTTLHVEKSAAPRKLAQIVQQLKDMAARQDILQLGDYQLDPGKRVWSTPDGHTHSLTEKEVDLLRYLADIHPQAASRDDVLRDVWKYAGDADTHTLETHLYRLRQKIEQNPSDPTIVVSTKQGYMLGIL